MQHPWFINEELPTTDEIRAEAGKILNNINDTINNWYTATPVLELHAIEDNILGVYRGQRVFADKEDVDYAEEDYNDEDLQ